MVFRNVSEEMRRTTFTWILSISWQKTAFAAPGKRLWWSVGTSGSPASCSLCFLRGYNNLIYIAMYTTLLGQLVIQAARLVDQQP